MRSDTNPPTMHDLRGIVAEVLELEPGEINDSSDLIEENDADSLLLMEIVVRLEQRYGIEILQDSVPEIRTLEDIRRVVMRHLDG